MVTDLAKIQLMKMLDTSAHSEAARPRSSVPWKKLLIETAWGETAYITTPYSTRKPQK